MQLEFKLDGNQRPNHLLGKDLKGDSDKISHRIFNVAIPFLHLYRPTQIALTISMGTIKCYQILISSKDKNVYELGFVILNIGLTVLKPTFAIYLSQGLNIVEKISHLSETLLQNKMESWNAKTKETLQSDVISLLSSVVYISSIYFATPGIIAISLISQGLFELQLGYKEYKRGRYLEACVNTLLAGIRFHQSIPHSKQSYLYRAYKDYEYRTSLKKALYNNPNDSYFIVSPKGNWDVKPLSFDYKLKYTYIDDADSGSNESYDSVAAQGKGIKLSSEGQNPFLYYLFLPNPFYKRLKGSIYGGGKTILENGPNVPDQYLNFITNDANITSINHANKTLTHSEKGEGRWELKTIQNKNGYSLFFAAFFGDAYSSQQWFQEAEKSLVLKNK